MRHACELCCRAAAHTLREKKDKSWPDHRGHNKSNSTTKYLKLHPLPCPLESPFPPPPPLYVCTQTGKTTSVLPCIRCSGSESLLRQLSVLWRKWCFRAMSVWSTNQLCDKRLCSPFYTQTEMDELLLFLIPLDRITDSSECRHWDG